MKFLVVIDMQNDFVSGALAREAAKKTIPYIKEQLELAVKNGDTIVFTRDTHSEDYMNTLEGKYLPVKHCVEGTDGWQIVPELEPYTKDAVLIDKNYFGYDNWIDYIKDGDEVSICGTVTDICVISNALAIKALGEVNVTVLKDGCSGLTPEKHEHALDVMASCQCIIK